MKTVKKLSLRMLYPYMENGKEKFRAFSYAMRKDVTDENILKIAEAVNTLTEGEAGITQRNETAELA